MSDRDGCGPWLFNGLKRWIADRHWRNASGTLEGSEYQCDRRLVIDLGHDAVHAEFEPGAEGFVRREDAEAGVETFFVEIDRVGGAGVGFDADGFVPGGGEHDEFAEGFVAGLNDFETGARIDNAGDEGGRVVAEVGIDVVELEALHRLAFAKIVAVLQRELAAGGEAFEEFVALRRGGFDEAVFEAAGTGEGEFEVRMRAEAEGEGNGVGILDADVAAEGGAEDFVANFDQKVSGPEGTACGIVFRELELAGEAVGSLFRHAPGAVETEAVDGILARVADVFFGEVILTCIPFVASFFDAVGEWEEERDAGPAGLGSVGDKFGL